MEVLWKYRWIKSWVEIIMPDKCHQKSFPITCQAFRALWYNRSSLPLDNQNLAFVLHVPKMIQLRWFSWDDLSRNHRWVCFSSMGWGSWKAKVKIPRAPTYLSCFNICEARGTLQNGMSKQTHTHTVKVCLNLCGQWLDPPLPFPEEEKCIWCFRSARPRTSQEKMLWVTHV